MRRTGAFGIPLAPSELGCSESSFGYAFHTPRRRTHQHMGHRRSRPSIRGHLLTVFSRADVLYRPHREGLRIKPLCDSCATGAQRRPHAQGRATRSLQAARRRVVFRRGILCAPSLRRAS